MEEVGCGGVVLGGRAKDAAERVMKRMPRHRAKTGEKEHGGKRSSREEQILARGRLSSWEQGRRPVPQMGTRL